MINSFENFSKFFLFLCITITVFLFDIFDFLISDIKRFILLSLKGGSKKIRSNLSLDKSKQLIL